MDSELDFDVYSFLYDKNRNSSSSESSFRNMFVYRTVQNVMEMHMAAKTAASPTKRDDPNSNPFTPPVQ
jgi:hypothetical protein